MAIQENRDNAFDAFRGIAIISVIAMHASLWTFPKTGGWELALVAYQQLLNFAVPAFIFISGYWLSKKPMESLQDYKKFLTKRLPRVLVPYVFWSLIWLGYSAVRTGYVDGYKIAFALLTGNAIGGYYFVMAIAQLYVLTPFIRRINRALNGYGLILIIIFNMVVLAILYFLRVLGVIGHLFIALPFYSWIVYYAIGLFIGDRHGEMVVTNRMRLGILLAILVSWLLSVLEGMFILSRYDDLTFAIFPVKYSSFLYCVCVILGFLFVREYFRRLPRLLSIIGHYSFGIYLIHIMILSQVVRFFEQFSVIYSFQLLYQFILVVVTLVICLALIGAARKLLPEVFCSKILGF